MARKQIHIDDLREKDPKTLEVVLQDALRKPIQQISPQTLADMVALSELDELPKNLGKDLGLFTSRVGQEVADLPDGDSFQEFLGKFDEVDAKDVPGTFRDYIEREAERDGRDEEDRDKAKSLISEWKGTDPEDIELSSGEPDIEKGKTGGKSRGKGTKTKVRRVKKSEDPARVKWISAAVLEKLTGYREKGLNEQVLMAGVRHEAKDVYPDLMPWEIKKVLRSLQDAGQVKRSAGRWSRVGRFW